MSDPSQWRVLRLLSPDAAGGEGVALARRDRTGQGVVTLNRSDVRGVEALAPVTRPSAVLRPPAKR